MLSMSGKRIALTAGLLMGAMAQLHAQQSADKAPFLVGTSNELTGPTAVVGRPYVSGAATYFRMRNDQGGVNGHPIKLTVLDDQANPDLGVANVKKLLGENIVVMLAPVLSAVGIPMLPVMTDAKVPMVAYTGVEPMESNAFYYAVGLDGTHSFGIAANYIKSQVKGPTKVAFLTVDSPASLAASGATTKLVQSWGWQVVANETFPSRATEFNAQILKLADAKPDFIIGGIDDAKSPVILPGLKRSGLNAPVINFQSGNAEASFRTIASDQFIAVREYMDPSEASDATKVIRDAAAKYGTTSDMTSNVFTKGWIAGEVIASALESCGDSCTGEKVKAALDKMTDFDTHGLGPKITLSATRKLGVTAGRLYQWSSKDNRAVPITDLVDAGL